MRWACLLPFFLMQSWAEVQVKPTSGGWSIRNEKIALELTASPGRPLRIASLQNLATKAEWAVPNSTSGVALEWSDPKSAGADFGYVAGQVKDLRQGGKQLTLQFVQPAGGARLELHI